MVQVVQHACGESFKLFTFRRNALRKNVFTIMESCGICEWGVDRSLLFTKYTIYMSAYNCTVLNGLRPENKHFVHQQAYRIATNHPDRKSKYSVCPLCVHLSPEYLGTGHRSAIYNFSPTWIASTSCLL